MTTDQPDKEFLPELSLGKIAQHPDNPRHDVGDVTDLAASIKDHGVLEPLVVVPRDLVPTNVKLGRAKTTEYALIAGHRRLTAAKAAKVKTVPVIVRHDLATREEQVAAMVIENQHRADLSPVEEGEAYQMLLDITPKSTQATVAAAVGMPKQRVSERVRLTKLSQSAREKLHAGQAPLADAVAMTAFADDETWAKDLEKALGTHNFAYTLQRARDDLAYSKAYTNFVKELRASGMRELPAGDTFTDLDEDAMKKVRGVEDLRSLGPWIGYGPVTTQWPILRDRHADCPHAAFYVNDETRDIYFVCLDATVHDATAETETPEQRKAHEAREQAEAERQQREDARQAAATVRRRHIREWILSTPVDKQVSLLGRLPATFVDGTYSVGAIYDWSRWAAVAEVLAIDPETPMPNRADTIRAAVLDVPAQRLPGVWWFLAHIDEESSISTWHAPNDLSGRVAADYVAELTDVLAYTWSDFEREDLRLDDDGYRDVDPDEGDDFESGEAA